MHSVQCFAERKNMRSNCIPVLLALYVVCHIPDSETAADEVVLNIHHNEGRLRTHNLKYSPHFKRPPAYSTVPLNGHEI